jgi:hypothetical protein
MNTKRELFLLFKPQDLITAWLTEEKRDIILKSGYNLVYKHTFPNDEPPYIMVSYWDVAGTYEITKEKDEDETYTFYLIRTKDVKKFTDFMNENQDEYTGYYLEGIMTRNAGEHNISPREYADHGIRHNNVRQPKVKHIFEYPSIIKQFIHTT